MARLSAPRDGKPRSQRSKRAQKTRESKLVENAKTALVMKGTQTSQVICDAMTDLASMKKPFIKKLTRKNRTHPIEDQNTIEFLSRMNDTSLLLFGSHAKKRPHNLVMGRFFDHQMLDLFEFAIDPTTMVTLSEFSSLRKSSTAQLGSKPMFFFAGEDFELNADLARFRNFIVDFFQGERLEKLNLAGLDRVIVCAAVDPKKILFRQYAVALKKSGTKIPKVKLEEIGPRFDLTLRRTSQASQTVIAESVRQPKLTKSKTQRGNVEQGVLGQTLGRVHMQRQDLVGLALRKMKGLKKDDNEDEADNSCSQVELDEESGGDVDNGMETGEDEDLMNHASMELA